LDEKKDKEERKVARAVFLVRNIDCTACALGIEKRVKKVTGVKDVRAAVMLNEVFIDYDESEVDASEIMKAIEKSGYSNYLLRKEKK
jgi:P-type Cu+ transporter